MENKNISECDKQIKEEMSLELTPETINNETHYSGKYKDYDINVYPGEDESWECKAFINGIEKGYGIGKDISKAVINCVKEVRENEDSKPLKEEIDVEKLSKDMYANGPAYKGADYPIKDKFAINEENIPHNMRFKDYDVLPIDKNRIKLYWLTQEPFDNNDYLIFKDEVKEAFSNLLNTGNYATDNDELTLEIEVSSRDYNDDSHVEDEIKFTFEEELKEEIDLNNYKTEINEEFDKDGTYIYTGGEVPEELKDNITKVIISENVTDISYSAFAYCEGLTSITIPNSVTHIGEGAFYFCKGLTSITIPDSVTSIGSSAFAYCRGLESITIPNSVTNIGTNAFDSCTGLTSITISNSVKSISQYAFYHCSSLTNITIPNSVKRISFEAFSGCTGLTSITIPDTVTHIGPYAFYSCTNLTSVTIGNRVTRIGRGAFEGCTRLTSVTIPNSVTSIGEDAFVNCSPNIVFHCEKGLSEEIIEKLEEYGKVEINESTNTKTINIQEELRKLDRKAFRDGTKFYDFKSLYEATKATEKDKRILVDLLNKEEDPEVIYQELLKIYKGNIPEFEWEIDENEDY